MAELRLDMTASSASYRPGPVLPVGCLRCKLTTSHDNDDTSSSVIVYRRLDENIGID